MERLYLDNAATTPTRPEVVEAMLPFFTSEYANPSSMHSSGQRVQRALQVARKRAAHALGARPEEIIFTSGGSEADSLAIFGALTGSYARAHFVTSAIEHHAVLHAADALRARGHKVTVVPVDREGFVVEEALRAALDGTPSVVSIMHGNNEIGTLQDIARLAALTRERGGIFHSDAVQTVGHLPIDVGELHVDALSLSAHKFEGPKGMGALYARKGLALTPLIYGGGQEGGRRAGTENVAGAVGLSLALSLAVAELAETQQRVTALRDALIDGLLAAIPGCALNGSRTMRLPNNVNVRFEHIEGDTVVVGLDLAGVEISTGSACSSGSLEPSHVMQAIGLVPAQARGSIRLSLGRTTTKADVKRVLDIIPSLIGRLRGLSDALTVEGSAALGRVD
ncbi:MAG TPA: aminotransferase class V-fold PLP-dependent enzyme [Candidatus Eremiobacteraceae bacterium]|nr:aminotransferase class V-fold PLP-dependent enzyme [Candidatus Eremiobacteraceae bacterium]